METQNKFKLYLGRNMPDNGFVSDVEIQDFIEDTIAPAFPGLTIYDASGYWKRNQEECIIVEIITATKIYPTAINAIETIARAYKKQFQQESVLITRGSINVEFV